MKHFINTKNGFTPTPRCFGVTCKRQGGFTLVEMLIYVGILALVIVGAITALLSMGNSFNRMRAAKDLGRSADTVLERFIREVREAESVDTDVSNSTFDTSPGKLTLNKVDGGTTVFDINGDYINIAVDGIVEGNLTLPSVVASSTIFRHITSSSSEAVRLELILESTRGSAVISETFYTTAVLRGSYAEE